MENDARSSSQMFDLMNHGTPMTVLNLFDNQVLSTPHHLAVITEDQTLTYTELDKQSNILCHYLVSLNLQPETIIGIYVNRGLATIISILGILKSGCAYLPLDTHLPNSQLEFLLQDAKVSTLIMQKNTQKTFKNYYGKIIELDKIIQNTSNNKISLPAHQIVRHHLAYVIYTSGSTGRPKGVMIEHESLAGKLLVLKKQYGLNQSDRCIHYKTYSFDASIEELLLPLIAGASFVIAPNYQLQNIIETLLLLIQKYQITTINLIPSLLTLFIDYFDKQEIQKKCASLKRIIAGGEILPMPLAQKTQETFPHIKLYNMYGPTENTIDSTVWEYNRTTNTITAPIGKPLADTEIYILDKQLMSIKNGQTGELYLGGKSLARGYLNRPILTRQKFIPNPYHLNNPLLSPKLYRTGDLVCQQPDGNLLFLGRTDNQIKIRGFRIEPEEIEAHLHRHPQIKRAVVIPKTNSTNETFLVAYIIPHHKNNFHQRQLRQYLTSLLPLHMIPDHFVLLDTLPHTPQGKINRVYLKQKEFDNKQCPYEFNEPVSTEEIILKKMWSTILAIPEQQIKTEDNFFKLGGHSLSAIQLLMKLQKHYHAELKLKNLFIKPTIENMLHQIQKTKTAQTHTPLTNTMLKKKSTYPLTFVQQDLWLAIQNNKNNALYNMPFSLEFKGNLNIVCLQRAVSILIKRQAILRTKFIIKKNSIQQQIASISSLNQFFIRQDICKLAQKDINQIIQQETHRPFKLTQAPLLRAHLFKPNKERYILFICIHHLIFDLWSIDIFTQELITLYNAFTQKQTPNLPPLPLQYADFADWQQTQLSKKILKKQYQYWQNHMRNLPPLNFPYDNKKMTAPSYRAQHIPFKISKNTYKLLQTLSQEKGVTVFNIMLSTLQIVLRKYTHQKDIAISVPFAGRYNEKLASLIGYFAQVLPIRAELSNDTSFINLLKQNESRILDAEINGDIPFYKIIQLSKHPAHANQNPLLDTMLTFESLDQSSIHSHDINIIPKTVNFNYTVFNITLSLKLSNKTLHGTFSYRQDLFTKGSMRQFNQYFKAVLKNNIGDINKPIDQIQFQKNTTHKSISPITKCNTTATTCTYFEIQAKKYPNLIAVTFEKQCLSYMCLNQKANQLAHYLKNCGSTRKTFIALYMDRGINMIIGLLGIWKAGAIYVPIDSTYPTQRVEYMLNDTKASILITTTYFAEKASSPHLKYIINLDQPTKKIADCPATNLKYKPKPNDLAYVIYTSGSTGQPKGSLLTHQNITRLFKMTEKWFHFNHHDVWTLFHSIAFDFSIWEILGALSYGGKLVIVPYWITRSPMDFYKLISEEKVTILNQTPTAFSQLIETSAHTLESSLRYIIFGGETVCLSDVQTWFTQHEDNKPQLINMYGITETTVHATYYRLTKKNTLGIQFTPIGIPISDLKFYILNNQLEQLPTGVVGEIYIAGAGLSQGYLNQPNLTSKQFIPNPIDPDKFAILYKTGDLGRWRSNGLLEYRGRIDNQVKIRGFRIELDEIKAHLKQHPFVGQVIITKYRDNHADKLVAYLTPKKITNTPVMAHAQNKSKRHQLNDWEQVFDNIYKQPHLLSQSRQNISGWNSSYTNRPFPAIDMEEWIKTTINRIRNLQPKHVLEIGCGTGLLLSQLAPLCTYYRGTDFSQTALEYIKHNHLSDGANIELIQRQANIFDQQEQGKYDVVILNSTIQYFPNLNYLIEVLNKAIRCTKIGGHIFIGDIRNFDLLACFHTSIAKHRILKNNMHTIQNMDYQTWADNISQLIEEDKELTISPEFFYHFAQQHPKVQHTDIQLKRGYSKNEMTLFRYDVIFYINDQKSKALPYKIEMIYNYPRSPNPDKTLAHLIKETKPNSLWLQNIPNRRLATMIKEQQLMQQNKTLQLSKTFQEKINSIQHIAKEPEKILELGTQLGYQVKITWSIDNQLDYFDAVFFKSTFPDQKQASMFYTDMLAQLQTKIKNLPVPYAQHANTPHLTKNQISQVLRAYLQEKLPPYMIPNIFIFLKQFPRTTQGKIDIRALSEQNKPSPTEIHCLPRTTIEKQLAKIWRQVLHLQTIGTKDNFFDLGGHSLLTTQLITLINNFFSINLNIRSISNTPTIEQLAKIIQQKKLARSKKIVQETL